MLEGFDVKGQKVIDCDIIIDIDLYFDQKWQFEVKTLIVLFYFLLQTCCFSLHKILSHVMWITCEVLFAVSQSDGTHSL